MVENRRDLLWHERMQFTFLEMIANCTQCRNHAHGIAEVFELYRQNFHQSFVGRRKGIKPETATRIKFLINAAAIVPAGFNNATLVEHDNHIRVQDGREPVRDTGNRVIR
jgi:hypothetical protein